MAKKYSSVSEYLKDRDISNSKQGKQYKSMDEYYAERHRDSIIADINSRLDDYDAEVKKYADIYNSTFFDSNGKAKTGYLGNVGTQGKAATIQADKIIQKRNAISKEIDRWGKYLDGDYIKNINSYLTNSNNSLTQLGKDFQSSYDYYSQFKDQNEYDSYQEAQKKLEEQQKREQDYVANYDYDTAEKELTKLRDIYKKFSDEISKNKRNEINRDLQMYGYSRLDDLKKDLDEKEQEHGQAVAWREKYKDDSTGDWFIDNVLNGKSGTVDKMADLGSASPTYSFGTTPQFLSGLERQKGKKTIAELESLQEQQNPFATTKYIFDKNRETGGLYPADLSAINYHYYDNNPKAKFNTFANETEYELYERLIESGQKEAAEAYVNSLDSELEHRMADQLSKSALKDPLYKYYNAPIAGAEGALENAYNFYKSLDKSFQGEDFDEESTPTGQLVMSYAAAQSKGIDKYITESLGTTASMVPAVLLSLVPYVGTGLSGAMLYSQATGAAISEAKQKGYTDEQAMQYGTLVGAAELALEKILGGLPGIGKLSELAQKALSGVDNILFKAAGKSILSGVSEFSEEPLQAYLEPYIATIVSGEEYNAPKLLDALYQGLLGFGTGVSMSSVPATIEAIQTANYTKDIGKAINNTEGATRELVELGKTLPKSKKYADKTKSKQSAYNTGKLYEAVGQAITPENEEGARTYQDITNRLLSAVEPSSDVSAQASERINTEITQELDKTDMTEEEKTQIAKTFSLPKGIDPNSSEATQYVRDYVADSITAYEAGKISKRTGETIPENFAENYTPALSSEQADTMVKLGQIATLEAQQEAAQKREALIKRISVPKEELIKATKADTTLNKDQQRAAEIGEKLGVAVIYDDTTKYYSTQRDGVSFKKKGVILIDKNTTNPMKQVLVHELAHFSETAKSYAKLKKTIMESKALDNWLTEKGYKGSFANKISAYRVAKKNHYAENGEVLTKDGAEAEMIANFLGETIGSEKKIDKFMSELTGEQKKNFLDYVKEVIDWFKSAFTNSLPAEIRHIEKLYQKALKEAGENAKTKAHTENNLDSEYGEQFDISEKESVDKNELDRYNKRGWAEKLLSEEDRKLLGLKITEAFIDGQHKRLKDDTKVIDVNNKTVFVGGTYENPTIEFLFAFNSENSNEDEINRFIVLGEKQYGKYTKQDIKVWKRLYGRVYSEEVFVAYSREDYSSSSIKDLKTRRRATLPESFKSYGYNGRVTIRNGVYVKDESGIPDGAQRPNSVTEEQSLIPEDSLTPIGDGRSGGSIPERTRKIRQDFIDGKIGYPELVEGEAKLMQEAREKYGVIEEGENPQEKVKVPQGVEKNKNVSKYVRTILETGTVNDALAQQMGEKTLLGEFSHEIATDKKALEIAEGAVKNGTARNKWGKTVESIHSLPTKNEIAVGEKLLEKAMKDGKTVEALEIASDLVDVYTRAGQLVQSARLLKQMTGTGRLIHLQRTVNRINEDIQKKNSKIKSEDKKHPEIKIGENLAEELVKATTPEEVEAIAKEIEQDVANQMKVTRLDIANAWRYLCMLANPITHIRNLVGNMIFVPSVQVRRALQYVMEKALPAEQRTIAYKIDDKYREFAEKMVNDPTVRSVLDGTDKYTAKTKAMMQRKVLYKPLQAIYEKNSELLGGEDMWYKTRYYKNALASYLQARQIDLDKITEDELTEASKYAISEAKKNTYADDSTLARLLNKLKSTNALGYLAVEGIVPFRKTPINIIKRGIEYSPLGLVNTLTFGTAKLKKGNITASEYIYGLSAGGSGTIAFVMGMFLAAIGAASGGFGDDDESKYRKLLGEQEYALIIGDRSYTIDWAAPINIPFFMGVELMKQLEKQNGEIRFAEAVSENTFAMLDPIINLSMLSGLQRAFQALRYGEGSAAFGAIAESMVTNYASQFLPAVGGKVTSFVRELRKSNYIDKNSQIPSFAQSILNSVMAKSFGIYDKRNPYIDAWGRTVSQGGVIERFLENFISPGYFNEVDYTEVDVYLMELYEATGETSIFPDAANKYFNVKKVRKDLTADEYYKYAQAKGQYSFKYLKEFFDSDYVRELTPEEQVKAIEKIYKYANDKAKSVVSDYDVKDNNKTAYKEETNGRSVVQYFAETVESERYAPKLFNQALEDGDTAEINRLKTEILQYKKDNGASEKEALESLRESVTSYWKPLYIDAYIAGDSAEMQRITKAMESSGVYVNINETKREWYKQYKEKQRQEQKNK